MIQKRHTFLKALHRKMTCKYIIFITKLMRKQCRGPNKEKCKSISPSKASWGGAPTKRNAKSISPSKASWGGEDETAPYEDEPIKYKLLNIKEAQKVWDIMMS
ncbi:hypothetical protein AAFL23_07275 [Staphylococcus lugdunensis]|uniref:hypothetical protein n=2 Tax=Staphylococcus lugdunensis TaxID=28035 RepID=UPI000568E281|nr:hypothetical protein [Staphylococcus lugdunensis]OHQ03223.1 hypothetical protein HMPREF2555_07320 [Staphylococcus sp. HMSC064A01]OHQ04209.1 hypothetical protein HMPREF2654_07830 [Staphylococcus sp. HMSC064A09]AMG60640.1 hypothetical protein AL499_01425 [Staphylococcus lugdunensis]MCH8649795.1 hypothetical protein [Staphylococcus lugdunensis]MCI2749696.1 hypothetical protein [Staphylococcus lugdunensis]